MTQLSFRIFKGEQLVRTETLSQGVIKIGKVPSAHLRIEDESVSRMHAIIEVSKTEVSIIDLGSTRGTFVNGQKINKAKLQSGDSITLGDTRVEVMLVVGTPAPVPPPIPAGLAATVPAAMPPATMTMPAARPVTPIAPPVRPVAMGAMPLSAPISPAGFQAAMAESIDDVNGARAVEVAAMFGDSVVGVKHCMDPHGGKISGKTWALAAAGLAMLLMSAIAFYTSVNTAAHNKAGLEYHTRVAHKPAYSYRPQALHPAVGWAAFGGLSLGLFGLTAALVRMRRETKSPFYRIGTAPGVEQPLEQAPSASFPLVAPSGDDFVFNYTHGIDGELTVDGKSTSLAELAATGRARPSMTAAGALEIPIPQHARIRARAGQATFLVSAVAAPKAQAVPLFANLNARTTAYFAGSLAVHLGILLFLRTVPLEESGVSVNLSDVEQVSINSSNTDKEDVPPEQDPDRMVGDGEKGDPNMSAPMAIESGKIGKEKSERLDGQIEIKNNQLDPQLARERAVAEAREAAWFGDRSVLESSITSLVAQADLSSGFSDADVYGAWFGSAGESQGFGMGRDGFGRGGCPAGQVCDGIIGTGGTYNTIALGDRVGDGWRGKGGKGWGTRRTPAVPPITIGTPVASDGLDKAIIKRHIKRNIAKIEYCYGRELLARPGIEGSVKVTFLITSNGTVATAKGDGFDPTVASCVAGVVQNIAFPAPSDGTSVQVTYPFHFRAPGANQ